ncbi:Smr domain-containing protein [Candidatus Nitrotoga sp. HW29]|uniref:Smr/MutS family protein n=1 Tax=Candidatus Nitrotoga sp. HW29 TaxID=2886963 RepID=UPI001EF1A53E|nr:Smr/MutS family protein [Candidatus Nitrotoga sp. HW29]CAH1905622.1 Smr domain-containing protein [Candidatus Nitrotoga sp. HW29]
MKKKEDQPASIDAELFQQALDGVIPLPPSDRIPLVQPLRRVLSRGTVVSTRLIEDTLSDNDTGGDVPTEFLRSGMSRMILRKLRRGRWPMQDTLDLHGFHSDAARKRLLEFLRDAVQHRLRFVCVIHGKGWQAGGKEGVLKSRVRYWLPQYSEVLAFCEAPLNAGGSGAVWVLLKAGGQSSDIVE